jgi:thioredoxin reductase (NADPH)
VKLRLGAVRMNDSAQPAIKIYGTRGSASCYSIRDFLHRSDVPFEWIDLTSDQQARAEAEVAGLEDRRLPICEFPDGARIERATVRQVLEKLGWYKNPSREEYDLAIYGAGPAGLSAAVYGASEGLKTVVIERYAVGGQAGSSPKIENYLGFPEGISGADLAERAREQACRFGAEILAARAGIRGEVVAGKGIGYLDDGTKIIARASICATGVDYRKLGLPNEGRLFGAGVYYGAGASEAMLCSRQEVYLVGGGNSAGQAALHFARYAARGEHGGTRGFVKGLHVRLSDRSDSRRAEGRCADKHRGHGSARRPHVAGDHSQKQQDRQGMDSADELALSLPRRRAADAMGSGSGRPVRQ